MAQLGTSGLVKAPCTRVKPIRQIPVQLIRVSFTEKTCRKHITWLMLKKTCITLGILNLENYTITNTI